MGDLQLACLVVGSVVEMQLFLFSLVATAVL